MRAVSPPLLPINQFVLGCMLTITALALQGAETEIAFSKEILPLLSDNCFGCHGPDGAGRKAGLRLDQREGALATLKSGARGVVPGDANASEIHKRLISTDPDEQMPPPDSGKSLTDAQIKTIEQWIESGAEWGKHWAFEPPSKPNVPKPKTEWSPTNPIDHFIHQGLTKNKITPEAQADKATLIRRVTLDLTGLPPTLAEVETFLADDTDKAYENLVDRLLRSKKYGENMARLWLDAARYADTHGLHLDNERTIWPYRDWVIEAFNRNQPFDEFTVEQLAGDLLPEPNLKQRVATGFNRCNVTTSEGGSIDEEYYVRYAVDRVETTSTVWLGLTAGCAACHDHKFDPLSQKEFYQLFSYFFSLTEKAMDGNIHLPPPSIKVPTAEQRKKKKEIEHVLTGVQGEVESLLTSIEYKDERAEETLGELDVHDSVWVDDTLPEGAQADGNEGKDSWQTVEKAGRTAFVRTASESLSQHFFLKAKQPLEISAGDRLYAYVYLDPNHRPKTLQLQFNDGNWEHRAYWGADRGHGAGRNNASNLRMGKIPETGKWVRLEVAADAVGLNPGSKINGLAFTQFSGTVYWDKAGIVTVAPLSVEKLASFSLWQQYRAQTTTPTLPEPIQKILDTKASERKDLHTKTLTQYYLKQVNPITKLAFADPLKREADTQAKLNALNKAIPSTLVMQERKKPRQAHILERGQYTEKRDKVASRIPEWISPPLAEAQDNRLGLAQWLVKADHPLTSRVTVNRYWQQLFGTGLVKTSEDFGVQGEHPSHPELLDWLALDFIESGWNVKRFLKSLAMSSTYRQSSRVTPEKLALDPENRLLARGSRFRLDAEVIRDQALAISNLLVDRTGGESVKPYQPAGLWKPVAFGGSNTQEFKQDSGDKLYRRSMYTFWKRTSPPPSMTTFDAPDRETCQVRRARTNTPLQALVLMNDVQFFEAARKFAERVLREGGVTPEQRLQFAFRSVLSRHPAQDEIASMLGLLQDQQAEYGANPDEAKKLLGAGESPRDETLPVSELAAWTMVTHLILNLSETVTKG